jgi:hypothetical protein
MYSKKARDRAVQCAITANQAFDEGVRSALLDLSAAYMKLARELDRSQEALDVTRVDAVCAAPFVREGSPDAAGFGQKRPAN